MTAWLPSALVNHLWQSTIFVLVVWLATVLLRRKNARIRFWLWMGASVKFLLPLSALVGLGAQFHWHEPPAAVQPAVSFVLRDVLTPAVVSAPAAGPRPIPDSPVDLSWLLQLVWSAGTARGAALLLRGFYPTTGVESGS